MKLVTLLITLLALIGCAGPDTEHVGESRQALESFELFLEHATIGVHMVGPDGTILWANPTDYEPLGYSAANYLGHDIHEFHASQATIEEMLSILGAGGELINYPAQLLASDGSIVYVSIRSKFDFVHGHTRCFTSKITLLDYLLLLAEHQ